MHYDLKKFVESRLVRCVGGTAQVRTTYYQFLDTLPHNERRLFPRWRFCQELKELGISISKRNGVQEMVGLSLVPTGIIVPPVSAAIDRPVMSAAVDRPDVERSFTDEQCV